MGTRKVAVITGAAQGIGKQTATVLNGLDWSLVLVDLQPIDTSVYGNALSLVGDITDETFCSQRQSRLSTSSAGLMHWLITLVFLVSPQH